MAAGGRGGIVGGGEAVGVKALSEMQKKDKKQVPTFVDGRKGLPPTKLVSEKEDVGPHSVRGELKEEVMARNASIVALCSSGRHLEAVEAFEALVAFSNELCAKEGVLGGAAEEFQKAHREFTKSVLSFSAADDAAAEKAGGRAQNTVNAHVVVFANTIAWMCWSYYSVGAFRGSRQLALMAREQWRCSVAMRSALPLGGMRNLRPLQYMWGLVNAAAEREGGEGVTSSAVFEAPAQWVGRKMVEVGVEGGGEGGDGGGGGGGGVETGLRVLSVNILAQLLHLRYSLQFCTLPCDGWDASSFSLRMETLKRELVLRGANIVCLQEVDKRHWASTVRVAMEEVGYDGGAFFPRIDPGGEGKATLKEDGTAVVWRTSEFQEAGEAKGFGTREDWASVDVEPVLGGATFVALQPTAKAPKPPPLVVVSAHINPARSPQQVAAVLEAARKWGEGLREAGKLRGEEVAVVAGGDWNGMRVPEFEAIAEKGFVAAYDGVEDLELLRCKGEGVEVEEGEGSVGSKPLPLEERLAKEEGVLKHGPTFEIITAASCSGPRDEISTTHSNACHFGGHLDDILFQPHLFHRSALLQTPDLPVMYQGRSDMRNPAVALPAPFWGSDHVPVAADLRQARGAKGGGSGGEEGGGEGGVE